MQRQLLAFPVPLESSPFFSIISIVPYCPLKRRMSASTTLTHVFLGFPHGLLPSTLIFITYSSNPVISVFSQNITRSSHLILQLLPSSTLQRITVAKIEEHQS